MLSSKRWIWLAAATSTVAWISLRVLNPSPNLREIWVEAQSASGILSALLVATYVRRFCNNSFAWTLALVGGVDFALHLWAEGRFLGQGLVLFAPIFLLFSVVRALVAFFVAKALR